MFCCTTLRDVIFAEWYFVNVISTTGILQHAVVCRVTTALQRALVESFETLKDDAANARLEQCLQEDAAAHRAIAATRDAAEKQATE